MKFNAKVQSFLGGKHFAKLATLMKDGRPQLTPIWYMYEDGKLIVNTTEDRVKYRNMKRDPRVSLLIDDGYPYVSIWGKARIATERNPNKDIETLAIRYTGVKAGRKAARERYWKQKRVSVEIIPQKIVSGL
jgi:PPOX class probable F420-dependent enzyme